MLKWIDPYEPGHIDKTNQLSNKAINCLDIYNELHNNSSANQSELPLIHIDRPPAKNKNGKPGKNNPFLIMFDPPFLPEKQMVANMLWENGYETHTKQHPDFRIMLEVLAKNTEWIARINL